MIWHPIPKTSNEQATDTFGRKYTLEAKSTPGFYDLWFQLTIVNPKTSNRIVKKFTTPDAAKAHAESVAKNTSIAHP